VHRGAWHLSVTGDLAEVEHLAVAQRRHLQEAGSWSREWEDEVTAAAAADIEAAVAAAEGLAAEGVSVLAWSPLAGGFLTPWGRRHQSGRGFPPVDERRYSGMVKVLASAARQEGTTPAAAALAWVLSRPGIAAAVVGASGLKQLREDLAMKPLSPKALGYLDQASMLCSRASGPKGPEGAGTFVQL